METERQVNIYEIYDPNGDPVKFICSGHIDSVSFRDKCFRDYFVKPLVVQHQWQKTRKSAARKIGKRFFKGITRSVPCNPWENGAMPVTVGLLQ